MRCPSHPASTNPAVEWISRPRRPRLDFPFESRNEVVGLRDALQRRAEHELAGVQDEGAVVVDLDQLGEIFLRLLRVDERRRVVAEDAEVAVDPQVDGRRLDRTFAERIDDDAAVG